MYARLSLPFAILALMLVSTCVQAEPKRIKKWVDDQGVTHYGDVLPPSYAGEVTTEMNSQGIKIKRKTPTPNPKDKQLGMTLEINEQERRDKALLDSFTTDKEIDLARDRNLQMDHAAVQSLQMRLNDAEQRLLKTDEAIAGFSKRKRPVPSDLLETQKLQQGEIKKIREQIQQKQTSMDGTRARFDNDKKRFLELKAGQIPPNDPSANAREAIPDVTPARPAP